MPKSKKMKKGSGWFDGLTSSTTNVLSSASSGSWWNWGSTKKTPSYTPSPSPSPLPSQPQSDNLQSQSQPQSQPYGSSSMTNTNYSYGGRKRKGKARGGSSLAEHAAPVSNSHTAKAHWVGGKRTRKNKNKHRKSSRKH